MLTELHVKNIALIDDCTLSFGSKLNVLSGETGAGKSVIIGALGYVLGARADKSLIRHGQTTASVEAVFDISDTPAVKNILSDMDIEMEDDILILYRTMSETKSDIRINGRIANLAMLRDVSRQLVDILGQHENQSLLSVSTHIKILDKYGEEALAAVKDEYDAIYAEYKDILRKLSDFGDEESVNAEMEDLQERIDEISVAELKEGEEEELLSQREKSRNAEKILNAVAATKQAMDGDDAFSVPSAIFSAMTALRQVASLDKALEADYERLDAAYTETKDIISELEDYIDSFDFDAAKAEYIERRVDLIRSLKRKYAPTVEGVLEKLESYRAKYASLSASVREISKLEKKIGETRTKLANAAEALTLKRKECAAGLKSEIERELSALGMEGSIFEACIVSSPDSPSQDGIDSVEFLISPNPGEPLRSLSKIISGGEMSRFMLALKVITARLEGISTLVFDEVDAGISGRIGAVVAEKLAKVSRSRQVIAITHLPQVAAMSDEHYLIAKHSEENKTFTTITRLDESGVIGEIERLAAGVGEYGVLHAKELRARALSIKSKES